MHGIKKSDLKTDINVAKKELGDLKTLLKRYHDLSEKGNNEVEKAKTISEKANILNGRPAWDYHCACAIHTALYA